METKICTDCGESKAMEEFHKQTLNHTGRTARCKACTNVREKVRTRRRRNLDGSTTVVFKDRQAQLTVKEALDKSRPVAGFPGLISMRNGLFYSKRRVLEFPVDGYFRTRVGKNAVLVSASHVYRDVWNAEWPVFAQAIRWDDDVSAEFCESLELLDGFHFYETCEKTEVTELYRVNRALIEYMKDRKIDYLEVIKKRYRL